MGDLQVEFIHPTDGRTVSVTVDDTMTGNEAIEELIANDFINASQQGYNLAVKGGNQIHADQSFLSAGVKNNDKIRIIPATDAGKL